MGDPVRGRSAPEKGVALNPAELRQPLQMVNLALLAIAPVFFKIVHKSGSHNCKAPHPNSSNDKCASSHFESCVHKGRSMWVPLLQITVFALRGFYLTLKGPLPYLEHGVVGVPEWSSG